MLFYKQKKYIFRIITGIIFIILPSIAFGAQQVTDIIYQLEVPLGNIHIVNNLAHYIEIMYTFVVGAVGILVVASLMYGGFRWAISAGNEQEITKAKETIKAAIMGLIIVVGSYGILYFINPSLTKLDAVAIDAIEIPLPDDKVLYDLQPCTDSQFIVECGKTPCGEICEYENQSCRGTCCSLECVGEAKTDNATEGCAVAGMTGCGCYPKATEPFGMTGSYKCQKDDCGKKVDDAIKKEVDHYNDYIKRNSAEGNQIVQDYLCATYNAWSVAKSNAKLECDVNVTVSDDYYQNVINNPFSTRSQSWAYEKHLKCGNINLETTLEYCEDNLEGSASNDCDFGLSCFLWGRWTGDMEYKCRNSAPVQYGNIQWQITTTK